MLQTAPSLLATGHYLLRPGLSPGVEGTRPVLDDERLGRLLHGCDPEQACAQLGQLFTLCAHAHRRTAVLALNCARGQTVPQLQAVDAGFALDTARDHLRSIALDWPQRAGLELSPRQTLGWLARCPVSLANSADHPDAPQARASLAALCHWLQEHVLHAPVSAWLPQHREPQALAQWCQDRASSLLPAHCLALWNAKAMQLAPMAQCLDAVTGHDVQRNAALRELGASLASTQGFAQKPQWHGISAENGPWCRRRHRRTLRAAPCPAWERLMARWFELLELALWGCDVSSGADEAGLLFQGALSLGEGRALAWTEMARGLLCHWAQLDRNGRVIDYRVLAPTEWNFHPEGTLARAISALPAGDAESARTLAAAFDPCVACTVLDVGAVPEKAQP